MSALDRAREPAPPSSRVERGDGGPGAHLSVSDVRGKTRKTALASRPWAIEVFVFGWTIFRPVRAGAPFWSVFETPPPPPGYLTSNESRTGPRALYPRGRCEPFVPVQPHRRLRPRDYLDGTMGVFYFMAKNPKWFIWLTLETFRSRLSARTVSCPNPLRYIGFFYSYTFSRWLLVLCQPLWYT